MRANVSKNSYESVGPTKLPHPAGEEKLAYSTLHAFAKEGLTNSELAQLTNKDAGRMSVALSKLYHWGEIRRSSQIGAKGRGRYRYFPKHALLGEMICDEDRPLWATREGYLKMRRTSAKTSREKELAQPKPKAKTAAHLVESSPSIQDQRPALPEVFEGVGFKLKIAYQMEVGGTTLDISREAYAALCGK